MSEDNEDDFLKGLKEREKRARLAEEERIFTEYCKDLSKERINNIALALYRREIFSSFELPKNTNITRHFLPLMFFGDLYKKVIERGLAREIKFGMFYGDMSSSLREWEINGYPMLFSVAMLNKENTKKILERLQEIEKILGGKIDE